MRIGYKKQTASASMIPLIWEEIISKQIDELPPTHQALEVRIRKQHQDTEVHSLITLRKKVYSNGH